MALTVPIKEQSQDVIYKRKVVIYYFLVAASTVPFSKESIYLNHYACQLH